MEKSTIRFCQATLPPVAFRRLGSSPISHRKHKQGLLPSSSFHGGESRPYLMPAGESVSALLPIPQAGHKASQTQYQHQQDLEHGKRPSSSEGQG